MAVSIAELILCGLFVEWVFRKIKLPGLVGLLLLGVVAGPYVFGIFSLSPELLNVAGDWRILALVVILLRAGFELSREALSKVGGRAVLMSFVPCVFEVVAITLAGPVLLGLSRLESAILGSVLAAVSPAVVVPLMIQFIEEKRGAKRGAPTLVLAGASCDDAVAIVLCSSFLGMYVGESVNFTSKLVSVPISVVLGIVVGLVLGVFIYKAFDRFNPRATKRLLVLLGLSVLLLHLQKAIEHKVPFAALLSIMAVGFIILEKREHAAHEMSSKLGKVWVFAQILLFTLVGAQVNVPVAVKAGLGGLFIILIGLGGRSVGVQLCLLGSVFPVKERAFIGVSYLPKATVQAAIGALPLTMMQSRGMGTGPGEVILAIAVLSILVTAPVGAILISWAGKAILEVEGSDVEDPARQAALESEGKAD